MVIIFLFYNITGGTRMIEHKIGIEDLVRGKGANYIAKKIIQFLLNLI